MSRRDFSAITEVAPPAVTAPKDPLEKERKQLSLLEVLARVRDRDDVNQTRELQRQAEEQKIALAQKTANEDAQADEIVGRALSSADPKTPLQERVASVADSLDKAGLRKHASDYRTSMGAFMGHVKSLNDADLAKTRAQLEQDTKEFDALATGAAGWIGDDVSDEQAGDYYLKVKEFLDKHKVAGATLMDIRGPMDAKRALTNLIHATKAGAAQYKANLDEIDTINARNAYKEDGPAFVENGRKMQWVKFPDGRREKRDYGPEDAESVTVHEFLPDGSKNSVPVTVGSKTGTVKQIPGYQGKPPAEKNPTRREEDVTTWKLTHPKGANEDDAQYSERAETEVAKRYETAQAVDAATDAERLASIRTQQQLRATRAKLAKDKADGRLTAQDAKKYLDDVVDEARVLAKRVDAAVAKKEGDGRYEIPADLRAYEGKTASEIARMIGDDPLVNQSGLTWDDLLTAAGNQRAIPRASTPGTPDQYTYPVTPPAAQGPPRSAAPTGTAKPPAAPATATTEKRAVNPQTGEELVLRGGKWVKP